MKIHTLFTGRDGGVSLPPYESLNLAFHTGDDPAAVEKNRALLKKGIGVSRILWMDQVHSDRVEIVDGSAPSPVPACDAIVTNEKNLALAVMVADCIPMLLFDETKGVVAAVHAGRNGTFKEISAKTVERMQKGFGCRPADLKAKLGPSIGECCYEISEDLAQIVEKSFSKVYMNGRYLNLRHLNFDQLTRAGLHPGNIEISDICTRCSEKYFSYRREGVTGRFAGVIWIDRA